MEEQEITFKKITRSNLFDNKDALTNLNYDTFPYVDNRYGTLHFFNKKNVTGYMYAMKPDRWWRFVDMHLDQSFDVIVSDFLLEMNISYEKRNEALLEIQENEEINNINYNRLVIQLINHVFLLNELPKPVIAKLFEYLFAFAKTDGDKVDVQLEYYFLKSVTKNEVAFAFKDNLPLSFYNISILINLIPYINKETAEQKTDTVYKLLLILKNALLKEKQQIAAPFGYYYILFITFIHQHAAYDDMTGYNLALFNEIIPLLSQHIFRMKLFSTDIKKQIQVLEALNNFQKTFNIKVEVENYTETAEKFLDVRKMLRLFDELS